MTVFYRCGSQEQLLRDIEPVMRTISVGARRRSISVEVGSYRTVEPGSPDRSRRLQSRNERPDLILDRPRLVAAESVNPASQTRPHDAAYVLLVKRKDSG